MIPKELQNLIEKYCMGMKPTDAQFDEITDKAFALGADPAEVTSLMEKLQNGPTREQIEAQKRAEEQKAREEAERKAKEEAERKAKEAAERQKKAEAEKKRKEAQEAKKKLEAEAAKTAYMNIKKMEFANEDKQANILSDFGIELNDFDLRYLTARITYDSLLDWDKTITIYKKIIKPDGTVERGSISPDGFTSSESITVEKGKNNKLKFRGWGNAEECTYEAGDYKYELWFEDRLVCEASVTIKPEAAAAKTAYMNIHKMEFANEGEKDFISDYGTELNDEDIRYLSAQFTYDGLLNEDKKITIYKKIINPNGEVRRSSKSPKGYTSSETITVKKGKNNKIALSGWGNANESTFDAGDYRYELWFEDHLVYKTYFKIKEKHPVANFLKSTDFWQLLLLLFGTIILGLGKPFWGWCAISIGIGWIVYSMIKDESDVSNLEITSGLWIALVAFFVVGFVLQILPPGGGLHFWGWCLMVFSLLMIVLAIIQSDKKGIGIILLIAFISSCIFLLPHVKNDNNREPEVVPSIDNTQSEVIQFPTDYYSSSPRKTEVPKPSASNSNNDVRESLKLTYDYVYSFHDGFYKIQKNGKYGLANENGEVVAQPIYDYIYNLDKKTGLIKVEQDGKKGFLNAEGQEVLKPKYTYIYNTDKGSGLTKVEIDDKKGFINLNTMKEVTPCIYT